MGVPKMKAYQFKRCAVPGKTYRMGSSRSTEGPVRNVTVSPFALAATAVSVGQFKAHCELQQELRFGRLLFRDQGHVVGTVRGASKEAVAAMTVLQGRGRDGWVVASEIVQLVPTVEEYVARFAAFPNAESRFLQNELPATMLTWVEAAFFALCAGGRLPTEAEYELAARLDSEGRVREGDDVAGTSTGLVTVETAHFGQDWETGGPMPVHEGKPPALIGALHLAGNVWEYAADNWRETLDEADLVDPLDFSSPSHWHAVRGGSWSYFPDGARAAARNGRGDGGNGSVGARVAWPQDSPA